MKKAKKQCLASQHRLAFTNTFLVATLCSSLLASCKQNENKTEGTDSVTVKEMIIGASATNGSAENYYSGTIEEENESALSFTAGGTITQLKVKVGDRVRKGQLIASVDPTSVRNTYEMARATKMQVEDAYNRMKQLHDKGSLTEMKWVEAQSQLQQARSAESIARKNLNDCNLYAPFDGIISEKNAEVGQNMAPYMPIAKLVTTEVLNVKISVPEAEMPNISLRQHAQIRIKALGGQPFEGFVVEKGVMADPISRSYCVKIRLGKGHNGLLPGMVSEVTLDKAPNASATSHIVIPASLVQLADDNSNFVWVDEAGKAARRTIVCGEYQSNGVTIVNGLKDGDKLIVEGQQKVCSGTTLNSTPNE